ncbi:uncharacterized protein [Fopius arisanus]|uniref:Direct IAP-binding protein with low pI n=1 Tax=Fopius arisanus TaxID=64838 RepID=A0A9R1TK22_9HYME|nr:PREDICTED: uncharacterized protein LOC105271219 [Fopius arisanus]
MAFKYVMRSFLRMRGAAMVAAGSFAKFETEDGRTDPPREEQRVRFQVKEFEKLSFDYLIKQSSIEAVNSASQALTVTYTAIESTSKEYRKLLGQLINLMEETMIFEVSDDHRDLIIEVRMEMQDKKEVLTQLLGYMEYVQKMAEAVTNVSFLAGMDNLSISLSERMEDAQKQKEREVKDNEKLEKEYYKIQEQCVRQNKTREKSENADSENVPEELNLD